MLDTPSAFGYEVFTRQFDETIAAENLCDTDELERLRGFLDKQLTHLHVAVSRLANRLQRRLLAQQSRAWDFDLEEGVLDAARLSRVVTDPYQPLSFKARARHHLPRYGRDAAARQFRLDARPADHGRGVLRRHSGPHAGALRREGRNPRLHHPAVEGRPDARAMAGARASRGAPGRLNDLRHIIYKSADMPWRRARRNLGLMMREGLLEGEYRRRGAGLGA